MGGGKETRRRKSFGLTSVYPILWRAGEETMPKVTRTGGTTPAEVVAAARQGDEVAWASLFDLHYTRLYRFFRARLSSAEQAEDLASNTFMEAFRSISNFRWQGKPFEAWLFGIARHQLASYYRSARNHVSDSDIDAEPAVRDEFVSVEIRDILAALPQEYQTAIELRFIVGLSGVEAAAAMKKSYGAYRSLLFRAVKAFRTESARGEEPASRPDPAAEAEADARDPGAEPQEVHPGPRPHASESRRARAERAAIRQGHRGLTSSVAARRDQDPVAISQLEDLLPRQEASAW